MRALRITEKTALTVAVTMAEAAMGGVQEEPYLVDSEWVDEMTSLLAELKRARSAGDLDELFEVCGDLEKLISELVEVPSED